MATDVMNLTARLSLDTSAYESALHAAVSQGHSFSSGLGSMAAGLHSVQGVASSSSATLNNAAQNAAGLGASATAAAAATGELGEQVGNAAQAAEQLSTQTDNGGDSAREFGAQLQKATVIGNLMASAIKQATGAIVDFAKQSIGAGMTFDSSMSQVAATMGVTVDEVQELRDFAQQMGATTAFSATQAADALNYMALAGYDAEKSMEMLPNVLNLAASGGMDLARASDMITDTQSALGLSMEDTTALVNKMAKAASSSNTSVSQLGEAMLQIGGSAKKLKGGTTELATILGILADNGMKGAEGGTHLRNMLTSLMSPTKDATEMMDRLGVSLYDNEGNMRSLNDVFVDLRNGMDNLATQAERDQVITSIFNARDMKAAEAMIANVGDRYAELSSKIDDAAGAAQDMANTQLDNLQGDITLFQSALEGAQIAVSDRLTPALRKFTQFGSKAVSNVSQAFGSKGLKGAIEALHLTINKEIGGGWAKAIFAVESATKGAIAAFVAYQAVVKGTAAVQAIIGVVQAIKAATTAQEALNAVAALNPWGAIAAAVAGVGIAVKSYIDAQTDAIDVTLSGSDRMTAAQKELAKAVDDTNAAVWEGAKARDERNAQADEEAHAIESLYAQLWRLNEMEELSNSQKVKMKTIVDTLNDSVSGLNLVIDEQTGKLKNNKAATDELIDSYIQQAKAEAARENLVELMKQQLDVEKNYNKALSDHNNLKFRRNELMRTEERLLKIVNDREHVGNKEWERSNEALKRVRKELGEVEREYASANKTFNEASSAYHAVTDGIAEMTEVLGGSADAIMANNEAAAESSETTLHALQDGIAMIQNTGETFYDVATDMAGATIRINGSMTDLSSDTATAIGELLDTYDSLVEKQKAAIESSVDFFGGFDKETSVTFEDLWNNLSSVSDGLTDWAQGIESLEKRGISAGLLQELKDMGLKSYNYVYDLSWTTDQQLKEYSDLWDKTKTEISDITSQMLDDQKESIETQLGELAGIPDAHIEDFKEVYVRLGAASDEGYAKGIASKLEEAKKAASDIGTESIDSTESAIDAHSPSRKFMELGRFAAEGFALGLNDEGKMAEIAMAARNIANEAIASVRETINSHSPSKVLREIGGFFSEGFALGIDDNADMAARSARDMADMAVESAYVEPAAAHITGSQAASPLSAEQMATINLTVDGKLMASVLAPLLDVINGKNMVLASRGRQL